MSPRNGKTVHFGETSLANLPTGLTMPTFAKVGLALIPFTPVPFRGSDALYAFGRIVVYSTATYLLHEKHRKIAYVFGAAAATCLFTSLSSTVWNGTTPVEMEKTVIPETKPIPAPIIGGLN